MPSTTPRQKTLLAWSSGKDSTLPLHVLRERGDAEVVGLLTTIEIAVRRVSMHETPEGLLDAQAEAVGLPLWEVEIPWPCPNDAYEAAMGEVMNRARKECIAQVAFGNLFLAHIREYRGAQIRDTGLELVFPLFFSLQWSCAYDSRYPHAAQR